MFLTPVQLAETPRPESGSLQLKPDPSSCFVYHVLGLEHNDVSCRGPRFRSGAQATPLSILIRTASPLSPLRCMLKSLDQVHRPINGPIAVHKFGVHRQSSSVVMGSGHEPDHLTAHLSAVVFHGCSRADSAELELGPSGPPKRIPVHLID